MNNSCDAARLYVAAIWSAATLASFQPAFAQTNDRPASFSGFEFSSQLDLDVALAAGDRRALRDMAAVDLRYRLGAEQITASGLRWGVRAHVAAQSGDGRRGFGQDFQTGPTQGGLALTGLATGFSSTSALDPVSAQVELSRAELFIKQNWLEWGVGWGPTAANQTNSPAILAMRLARADRALADPVGGGLAHTGLTLSAPAPRISVQSRRIIGLAVAASFTPEGVRCGVDSCRPAASALINTPKIQRLISGSVDFDRRIPSSGVRWRAYLTAEHAQAENTLAGQDDPWIVSAGGSREADSVTLSASYLSTNDGLSGGRYRAASGQLSFERGDWFYSIEIAHGDHAAFDVEGTSFSAGASRWIGDNVLLSGGVLTHEAGGVGAVLETGLRF